MRAPSSSGAPEGLVLTGVTMELAGTGGPAVVVPGVVLSIGAVGLTVVLPASGGTASGGTAAVDWSAVAWAHCGESGILADGTPAVAVAAVVAGRLIRWLVPEDQMPPGRALGIDHLLATRTAPHAADELASTGLPGTPDLPGAPGSPGTARLPGLSGSARSPEPGTARHPSGAGPTAPRRGRSVGILLAWLAVVVLAVVGAGLAVAGSVPSQRHPRHRQAPAASPSTGRPAARAVTRTVRLRLADLPAGWRVTSTPSGPLSGLVSPNGAAPASVTAARRYDQCLGVHDAAVPIVGGGSTPLARSTSGAFAGPSTGAVMEVASVTTVYATASPVQRAVRQLGRTGFASCFGAAVSREFSRSAAATAPKGVSAGEATVQSLPLPRWSGIRATGVDLTVPLDVQGEQTSVQLGFVFVTGARVEATLVSFATTAVPQQVSRALTAVLEEEVASTRTAASTQSASDAASSGGMASEIRSRAS